MIAITAARGNIGKHLVRMLAATSERVRILARDPSRIDLGGDGKVSDDATDPAALIYGVWLDDGSKLEPGTAPQTAPVLLTRAWSGKLYLGHKSECAPVNFELPGKPGPLKLRVAPIDLAGHVGKVASVSVEVPKPKDPPAPAPAKK